MDAIWLGLSPGARSTRVLAMRGPSETILKAHLSLRPSSPRAVTALLEAIALWEGAPVRAALAVDESLTSSCPTTLYRDLFGLSGDSTPLYRLEWVSYEVVRRRRRDGLTGMGDFGDLERLLALGRAMSAPSESRAVEIAMLGERLSALRLCDAALLASMRRSLERHGQLAPVTLFAHGEQLEILDGFKRVRAARALGWPQLVACVDDVTGAEAKLRLRELHQGRGLTELEEAWLVRSLYREDRMSMPQIGLAFGRHKSWVWRRLMLAEALEPTVQADVRLGLLAPRAAVAVSRLPRGNQQAASAVVVRRGLTVRQTELLVDELLVERDAAAREGLLARRLVGPPPQKPSGPRPSRAVRSEADWMSADVLRLRELAGRLEARLLATPLEALTPAAAELLRDALLRLLPVLHALERVVVTVTRDQEVA